MGIGCLTVYAFSFDTWRRLASEAKGIFRLLRAFLLLENDRLRQRGARLEVIGRRDLKRGSAFNQLTPHSQIDPQSLPGLLRKLRASKAR